MNPGYTVFLDPTTKTLKEYSSGIHESSSYFRSNNMYHIELIKRLNKKQYGFSMLYLLERWGNLRERNHWGDPDVDGRIILRWIFRKWEGVVGTGWSWLRIGTGGGHL